MSEYRGLRWIRDRQDTPRQIYEEFNPSSGWTQDSKFHYLLVDLPGYKRGDIKLQIDKSGTIAISGERLKGEAKHEHFEKAFTVPEDSDTENISMRFEGEALRVIIPRVAKEEKVKETRNEASSSDSRKEQREQPESPEGRNAQTTYETEKEQQSNQAEEKTSQDHRREDPGQGDTSHQSIIWKVVDCKEILLASILSFTLGFLLSQKIQHPSK